MTYTATDATGDTASRMFTITVTDVPDEPTFDRPVSSQTYPRGAAITPLVLPNATGGDPPLTYELSASPKAPPGLSYTYDSDLQARTLRGTPAEVGDYRMYYTVTDADGDKDELSFTVTVTESTDPTGSLPHRMTCDATGRNIYVCIEYAFARESQYSSARSQCENSGNRFLHRLELLDRPGGNSMSANQSRR